MAREVENNGVKYSLESRTDELYGSGVDVFMLNEDGTRIEESIAFVPGKDETASLILAQQWLKNTFPEELPSKGKKKIRDI